MRCTWRRRTRRCSNASGVSFRTSEHTFYGLGGGDAFNNLVNLSGSSGGLASVSENGSTGIAWVYEKFGETATGNGIVSEKLFLVDANDGGDANALTSMDWNILAVVDLSASASGWHRLGLSVDAAGNGTAIFDNQTFNFTVDPGLVGEFYVSYRENAQLGSVTVPSWLRPATFAPVPEPSTGLLLLLGSFGLWLMRRTV